MPRQWSVDRERIRQLLAKGLSTRQICLRMGCSESVVLKVRRDEGGKKDDTAAT